MRLLLILCLATMLAACEAPMTRIRYANPNATHEQFYDVSYQCQQKVAKVIGAKKNGYGEVIAEKVELDCDKFNACMESKGFTRSAEGTFLTSKDLELHCK